MGNMQIGYIILGVFAFALCIFCLVKAGRQICFQRKVDKSFESGCAEDKKQLYFAGRLLKKAFEKEDLGDLLPKYVELEKVYADSGMDEYQTFRYAKEHFERFDEEAVCTLVAIVLFGSECTEAFGNGTLEELESYKRRIKSKVKYVEIIDAQPQVLGFQPDARLGSKENPILTAGEKGIETYFDSLVAEDGTKLEYVHVGTFYVRDEELNVAYDLRKYSLRDAESDIEICQLWMCPYGVATCEQCVDGFISKKDILSGEICMADGDSPDAKALDTPTAVEAVNDPATGKPKLTWEAVDGADKYFIYRARKKGGEFAYRGASTVAEYIDTTAEPGVGYHYKVKSADTTNQFGHSAYSDICGAVCVLPTPVVEISAEEGTGRVKLTWGRIADAFRYEVYRSKSEDGDYVKMAKRKEPAYVNVAHIEPHVVYYYKVRAVHTNDAANSPFSAIVTGSWEPPTEETE